MPQPARTIDEVLGRLDQIIDTSIEHPSRFGYFAALYRMVTAEVKAKIEAGFFDDGPRMERLDVIFANRYLAAYDAHRNGGTVTTAWAYSFRVADQWWPIVLQHLLLGMNAHINLDLGIAAAETVPADRLPELEDDFNKINQVLAALVGHVKDDLAQIWWALRVFNRYLGSIEDAIINFSMNEARDRAWDFAQQLAPLGEADRARAIRDQDAAVAVLGRLIRHPGIIGSTVTKLVRLGERGSTTKKIQLLRETVAR